MGGRRRGGRGSPKAWLVAWLRGTPQGYVASREPAVLAAGVGIWAGFGIPHAGRAEGARAGSRGAVTAVPTALQSPPCSKATGTVPDPSATSNRAFFFFFLLLFLHGPRKIESPPCSPGPSVQVTPLQLCRPSPNLSWQLVSTRLRYRAL